MQKQILSKLALSLILIIVLAGCKDKTLQKRTYLCNVPVYENPQALRVDVKNEAPRAVTNPGKLHLIGPYLLVVDRGKGIHVINNANPANPININYIAVPGVIDMASKDGRLYIDSYKDLLTLDITDLTNVHQVERSKEAFDQVMPATKNEHPIAHIDQSMGVVIGWQVKKITEITEVINQPVRGGFMIDMAMSSGSSAESASGTQTFTPLGTGTSGSMARFSIIDNALYAINGQELEVFDIGINQKPIHTYTLETDFNLETIFPHGNMLLLGSMSGVHIYNASHPTVPKFISVFNHVRVCDPVVAQNGHAFATLRSNSICGGWMNVLDVLDINNPYNPTLVERRDMVDPKGLGIDGNLLFICDGKAGLKVYDATNPEQIGYNPVAQFTGFNAYDVIPNNGVLILSTDNGYYQYDYTDPNDIHLIAKIDVLP